MAQVKTTHRERANPGRFRGLLLRLHRGGSLNQPPGPRNSKISAPRVGSGTSGTGLRGILAFWSQDPVMRLGAPAPSSRAKL